MKRFKFDIFKQLVSEAKYKCDLIKQVFDIGFMQFEGEQLKAVYLQIMVQGLYTGFARFEVEEKSINLESIYITDSETEETRYDLAGEPIAKYYTVEMPGELIITKQYINSGDAEEKDNEQYIIRMEDIAKFPQLQSEIALFVESDTLDYKYFKKKNNEQLFT